MYRIKRIENWNTAMKLLMVQPVTKNVKAARILAGSWHVTTSGTCRHVR